MTVVTSNDTVHRHRKPKKRKYSLWLKIAAALLAVLLVGMYVVEEPGSPPGVFIFCCAYTSPLSKDRVLTQYETLLRENDGMYLSPEADKFLSARFIDASSAEASILADFYARRPFGRDGDGLANLPAAQKERVIALLLSRIETYGDWQREHALWLIEGMRQGRALWKGGFAAENRPYNSDSKIWWKSKGNAQLVACYRRWYARDLSWEQKRRLNPLAGMEFTVSEL